MRLLVPLRVGFALLLVACSGGGSSTQTPPPVDLSATSASADDVIVATVAGKPVWGSCVAAQARRGATRERALEDCIDFELAAQVAQARGLATDPEVLAATRTALVGTLVAREYEDKHVRPSDFGPMWDQLAGRVKIRYDHDEVRGSAYVRVTLAKTATRAEDAAARAVVEEIAAALAPERGLVPQHLETLATRIAAGRVKLDVAVVTPYFAGDLDKPYADALYAIAEVGRTSAAVRTRYGWDVILWNEVLPAIHPTPDELVAQLLPEIKQRYFSTWVNQVAAKVGAKVKIHQERFGLLEAR
jgi:hypothetical protein